MAKSEHQRKVVITDVRDEKGTMWRAVSLTEDGGLGIVGQDLGGGVEGIFGAGEYEFARDFSVSETSRIRALMGITDSDDLLVAIAERFRSTNDLETFAKAHGIPGRFWSRIGD